MSQDITARVYIDGGPVVRLQVPSLPGSDQIRMTRDEWRGRIQSQLEFDGGCLSETTVEGDEILIPAGRVIDVVFPISRQGAESGMDEDQRNYEAQLNAHGSIARIVDAYDADFVNSYLSDRSFGGEVVVQTKEGFIGLIVAFDDEADLYTLQGEPATPQIGLTIDYLRSVLCWEWEDVKHGTLDSLTSAGFAFGVESIAAALGDPLR